MRKISFILPVAAACLFSACAKKPVLYDNETYKKSPEAAQTAIGDCMKKAEEAKASGDSKLANAAYRGAAGGVASGAAGGAAAAAGNAFGGNYDVGGSVGMSAAAGTAGNVVLGMFDRDVDPIFANYVNTCLQERGYRVIGWN